MGKEMEEFKWIEIIGLQTEEEHKIGHEACEKAGCKILSATDVRRTLEEKPQLWIMTKVGYEVHKMCVSNTGIALNMGTWSNTSEEESTTFRTAYVYKKAKEKIRRL